MNIRNDDLGLTPTAKKRLLSLSGVETLSDVVEKYSKQELVEDYGFLFQESVPSGLSIMKSLKKHGLRLYPSYYERIKAQKGLPNLWRPEDVLLIDCDFPEEMIEKLKFWKSLKTLGDLSRAIKENRDCSQAESLEDFINERTVVRPRPLVTEDGLRRTMNIGLDLHEKRLLIRTLSVNGLYPSHARLKKGMR